MSWLKKKSNPLSDRQQALNKQIASLEAEIKRLDSKMNRGQSQPRLRSTAVPRGATLRPPPAVKESRSPPAPKADEPVFEDVSQERLYTAPETANPPEIYNELGVRKFDFASLTRRLKNYFAGPTTTNPKLVSYLAAGGIRGLQPLRKEKRIARNRFLLFTAILFAVLLGTLWWYLRGR